MHPLSIHNDGTKANIIGWFDASDVANTTASATGNRLASITSKVGTAVCDENINSMNDPAYFHGYMDFNGSNMSLASDDAQINSIAATDDYTMLAVVKTNPGATNRTICGWVSDSTSTPKQILRIHASNKIGLYRVADDTTAQGPEYDSSVPEDEWVVVGVRVSGVGDTVDFMTQGGVLGSPTAGVQTNPGAMTTTRFIIGSDREKSWPFLHQIAEVLVFDDTNADLSDADFREMWSYLYHKHVDPPVNLMSSTADLGDKRWNVAADDDITTTLQTIADRARHSGLVMKFPAAPFALSDTVVLGNPTDGTKNHGLILVGSGQGDRIDGSDWPSSPASATHLYWNVDDNTKPMFHVHNWGTNVRDITFSNDPTDGTGDMGLNCFFRLIKSSGVGTGKMHLRDCFFHSQLTDHPSLSVIQTAAGDGDADDNEDECHLDNVYTWHVARLIDIGQKASIGWYINGGHFKEFTGLCYMQAGGKVFINQCHFNGTANPVVFDLQGDGTKHARTTEIYSIRDSTTDGGNNTVDLKLVDNNTSGTDTIIGTFVFDNLMCQHDTQTVEPISLLNCDANVLVSSGSYQTDTGVALAKISGISSTNEAVFNTFGVKTYGGCTNNLLNDQGNVVHNDFGQNPEGSTVLPVEINIGTESKYPTDVGF